MAAKKPASKRDNTSPNTVLVVFLVLFVLLSIGLGVWGYYGYDGQTQLKADAEKANKVKAAAYKVAEYYKYLSQEYRLALGDALDANDKNDWAQNHKAFLEGKWKEETDYEGNKKFVEQVGKVLGFNDNAPGFVVDYTQRVAQQTAEINKLKAALDAKTKALTVADAKYNNIVTRYDQFMKTALASIKDGSDKARQLSMSRFDEMDKSHKLNAQLRNEIKIQSDNYTVEKDKLKLDIAKLQRTIRDMERAQADAKVANPRNGTTTPHALLLDISKGRPLWDTPIGKIARVDPDHRNVVINLGSADGVKQELTFNVFESTRDERAVGPLKGSVEVIQVLDSNTSLCRITSLYDASGYEIPLNSNSRGRVQRESEAPIKEGDLLFNMFWGTRIAIAGRVDWWGVGSSPADQMRNLDRFMHMLKAQGVIVDAYIDLADGSVKGALTAKTRYLLKGQSLHVPAGGGAPGVPPAGGGGMPPGGGLPGGGQPPPGGGGLPPPGAIPPPGAAAPPGLQAQQQQQPVVGLPGVKAGGVKLAGVERVQAVNASIAAMTDEAIARGMFVISPDNYAIVVGFRQPRSANSVEVGTFRPSLPASGRGLPPLVLPGAR